MSAKKPALGRGLGALLDASTTTVQPNSAVEHIVEPNKEAGISALSVKWIEANPFQPRAHFEKEALDELTASIKIHGIIQPITVRKIADNKYQIISGERRFRAAQLAGLSDVPVYIRTADDQTMLEMAIIENVQRKDLNAIEVALSYQRLIDECGITQEQVGDRVSKSRVSVTNYLRLLNLPAEVQAGIRDEKISMGHARALLGFADESQLVEAYRLIIDQSLSVRKVEELARDAKQDQSSTAKTKPADISRNAKLFQDNLAFHLHAKVKISKGTEGKGKITIDFDSEDHLNKIIALLDN